MMNRRKLMALLGVGAVAWPFRVGAQHPETPLVGVLHSGSPAAYATPMAGFHQGLAESGYVEGRNVAIEYRWAEGHYDQLPRLAAELVQRPVAVIAALAHPAAAAAKAATATIPIVFATGTDPVEAGFVLSLARPGGNMTGIISFAARLGAKRLQLLRDLVPHPGTIGLLLNPKNTNAEPQAQEVLEAARQIGQNVTVLKASSEAELETAFGGLADQKIGALTVGADPLFTVRRELLIALAAEHAIPAIYYDRVFTENGGLLSYGNNLTTTASKAGIYVGKILHGAMASDLPVEQLTRFELVINIRTAKALGLTVPPNMLDLADELIE